MKRLTKILLCSVVIALITYSIQSASAAQNIAIDGLFKNQGEVELISTKDTNYKIYLQAVIRNADGHLINVTESTAHGGYIPHMISDVVFDTLMSEKEIITVDGIKYEKAQWSFSPTLPQRIIGLYPIYSEKTLNLVAEKGDDTRKIYGTNKDYSIWKIHYCADWESFGYLCVPVYQVLIANMTLEPSDTIEQKWTVLREVGHSFAESADPELTKKYALP